MSVMHFHAQTLGNIVACLPRHQRELACAVLETFSIANTQAWNRSYCPSAVTGRMAEPAEAESAHNIANFASHSSHHDAADARQMLALAYYNTEANYGTEFLDPAWAAVFAEMALVIALRVRDGWREVSP